MSGEEIRFSTVRSLPVARCRFGGGRRSLGVWLARGSLVEVAPFRVRVRRIGATQWLAIADLLLNPRFLLVLLHCCAGHLVRQVLGDTDDAFLVADHDVPRVDRDLRAPDWN